MNSHDDKPEKKNPEKPERKWRLSRRGFLVGLAVTGTGFALGIPLSLPTLTRRLFGWLAGDSHLPWGAIYGNLNPALWIEIFPDDRIRLFVPKAELGQGTHTGLAQLVAEELEVRWEQLEVIHASTNQAENKYRGTFGSQSIKSLYVPFRQAAATMREMLRTQASLHLKQPSANLIARDGAFELRTDPQIRVSYGELVDSKTDWKVPDEEVPLKEPKDFKFIGKSMPRIDGRPKVTGQEIFSHDVRVEGMAYGAVARPPTIEAKMLSAQPGKATGMPGVMKVVIEDGFAGVVAKSRAQAVAARNALDIKWDKGRLWQQRECEQIVIAGGSGGVNLQKKGNAKSILKKEASLTAEYRTGLVSHACLETQAALADVNAKGGRVWTSTQNETFTASQVAKAIGVEQKYIELIPTYVGGGYGRKSGSNKVSSAAAEAARLSLAADVPVHVSWERDEEMCQGYVRPMTHHRFSAKLNNNGSIKAMAMEQAHNYSVSDSTPKILANVLSFDFGSTRGAWIHYAIPHVDVTVWGRLLPIRTGSWRGLGYVANLFPIESFMDELAHAAGKDPLQFRLDHLHSDSMGQRMRAVLQAAANRAGWGKALPNGRAQGIACGFYMGTVVAEVAEISFNKESGRIRAHRVVAAMDCGRAVNPNQVISQVEGCAVMGTSAALMEEVTVKDGRVETDNFDLYPLLTQSEAPEVETILIDAPDGIPRGVGEPPIGPIAPAIANAFFTLTGVRLRQLPMTPERVNLAMQTSNRG